MDFTTKVFACLSTFSKSNLIFTFLYIIQKYSASRFTLIFTKLIQVRNDIFNSLITLHLEIIVCTTIFPILYSVP